MVEQNDTWIITDDVARFGRTAVPRLALAPAANTLLLTVFERLRVHGPRAFGDADPEFAVWYGADGTPAGGLLRTPPFGYVLSHVPAEAAQPLVDLLLDGHSGLDGRQINLPDTVVEPFTAAWIARTGTPPRVDERNRLYRLDRLVPPDPAPAGRARRADLLDVPLVARFVEDFWTEVGEVPPAGSGTKPRNVARARIEEGAFWLWCDAADRPVSLAGHAPIVAGAGRIGPVYTPKEHRGKGYGAAVTATVARVLLDAGAQEVLLFTDLANPTSNALYQRIGFRPVSDRIRLELGG